MNTNEISRVSSEQDVLEQQMKGLNSLSSQHSQSSLSTQSGVRDQHDQHDQHDQIGQTTPERPSWYARDADGRREDPGDIPGGGTKPDNRRWVMPGDPDEPTEDPILSNVFPTPAKLDLHLLKDSIRQNGVLNAVIVWKGKGIIVDGHNRIRICKELGIPYAVEEMEFEDIDAAKIWMVKNQLGRRNVPPFVKVEMVLTLEPMLREEARKREHTGIKMQGNPTEIFPEGTGETRNVLGAMIGISGRTFDRAKWILENADQMTIDQLRTGKLLIHTAWKATKWFLEDADEFTKFRVQMGKTSVAEAYELLRQAAKAARKEAEEAEAAEEEEVEEEDSYDDGGDEEYMEPDAEDEPAQASGSNIVSFEEYKRRHEQRMQRLQQIQERMQQSAWNQQHVRSQQGDKSNRGNNGHGQDPHGGQSNIVSFQDYLQKKQQQQNAQRNGQQNAQQSAQSQQSSYPGDKRVEESAPLPRKYSSPEWHDPDDIPLEQRNLNLGPLTGPHSTSQIEDDDDEDPFDFPDFDNWEQRLMRKTDAFIEFLTDMFSALTEMDVPTSGAKRVMAILEDCTTTINNKYEEVFCNEE